MATAGELIHAALAADSQMQALLPGGILRVIEVKRTDVSTPPFDANGEIEACCNVKDEVETPWGIHDHSSRATVMVYFYAASSAAVDRAYALLDRQCLGDPADLVCEVRHVDDIRQQEEPGLLCSLDISRFEVKRLRMENE